MKSLTSQRRHNHLLSGAPRGFVDEYLQDAQKLTKNGGANVVAMKILRGLAADTASFLSGTKGLQRDLVTLEARLEHEGVAVLSVALATLGKALDKGISEGCFTCPVGFKKAKGGKIPALFSGIFCVVFDSNTGLLVKERDLTLEISLLRQLLYFLEEACHDGVFGREAEEFCCASLYARQSKHQRSLYVSAQPTCACFTITPFRFRCLSGIER